MANHKPIPSEPGVMIIGKLGEAPPKGYEPGRWLPTSATSYRAFAETLANAAPLGSVETDPGVVLMTPASCRAVGRGLRAKRLVGCWIGVHGPGVHIELPDGVAWPMYLLNLEHICDPLFDELTPYERDRIIDHFMNNRPTETGE